MIRDAILFFPEAVHAAYSKKADVGTEIECLPPGPKLCDLASLNPVLQFPRSL